jgi:glycogen synthase
VRALVLSNLYPPYFIGGYEIGCRDVVDALRARGHEITVLTSTYGIQGSRVDGHVYRWLTSEWSRPSEGFSPYVRHALAQEVANRRAFRQAVAATSPDFLYVWSPAKISLSLVMMAEEVGLPVVYFVSDEWMTSWTTHQSWLGLWARKPRRRLARYLRPVLRAMARAREVPTWEEYADGRRQLAYRHVQFASRYLLEAVARATGGPHPGWQVIHWGVDADQFRPAAGARTRSRRLLYVGQLKRIKGVHTAIDAVRILRHEFGYADVTLDVVGDGPPRYVGRLRRRMRSAKLDGAVRLCGPADRRDLPHLYREHDVLVFPSVWNEPFSITVLEGMASGLPVVGTLTGGSAEALRPEWNSLSFEKEDAQACASQVSRLFENRNLYDRLCVNARATVVEQFTIPRMVDAIEASLRSVVAESGGQADKAAGR